MRLEEYRPRTRLRVPVSVVERPRFGVIDGHNHLGPVFSNGWSSRPVADVLAALDEAGVETVVDLDGGQGEALSRHLARYAEPHPDRFVVFAGLGPDTWPAHGDFGEREARQLEDSAARGARGLKVWKALGLWARDPAGHVVAPDDERLDPLWETAARLGLPVVIHVADPIAFFDPLDAHNERWEELTAHPDWHFWPPRPPGRGDAGADARTGARPAGTGPAAGPARASGGFPRFDDILAGLDRLLARHPGTTFVGAHVGCAVEDLALVGAMLDDHPNFHVDIAARIAELGRQPYGARAFFLRYPERILFGTDLGFDPPMYRLHYRFLETFDEAFDYSTVEPPPQGRWQVCGLGLPDDVLRRVYRDNARRILLGDRPAAAPGGSIAAR